MIERVFISEKQLKNFGDVNNLSQQSAALLAEQKIRWDLLRENFAALEDIKIKEYEFGDISIKTQFNPSRIISSSAQVDEKSIANRACFLCAENLPEVQRGINYKDKYLILCNPYPIFKQHLTIPQFNHIPQEIESSIQDLLDLAFDLQDNFFIFYNGPQCGASAPDHLHFQAGLKYSIPIENYYPKLIEKGELLIGNEEIVMKIVQTDLLNFISIQSRNPTEINLAVKNALNNLRKLQQTSEESLVNIICFFKDGKWDIFIFPREVHRPTQYFLEAEERFLISPASIDMAGLLIIPREKDFMRLNHAIIQDIFSQVLFNAEFYEDFKNIYK